MWLCILTDCAYLDLGVSVRYRVLGTPSSGQSPKEREDKTSGVTKPMSRASAEMPVSWVLGLEGEDMRRLADTSVLEWTVGPHGLR